MLYTSNMSKSALDRSSNSIDKRFRLRYEVVNGQIDDLISLLRQLQDKALQERDKAEEYRQRAIEDLSEVEQDLSDNGITGKEDTINHIRELLEQAGEDLTDIINDIDTTIGCLNLCQTCNEGCQANCYGIDNTTTCTNCDSYTPTQGCTTTCETDCQTAAESCWPCFTNTYNPVTDPTECENCVNCQNPRYSISGCEYTVNYCNSAEHQSTICTNCDGTTQTCTSTTEAGKEECISGCYVLVNESDSPYECKMYRPTCTGYYNNSCILLVKCNGSYITSDGTYCEGGDYSCGIRDNNTVCSGKYYVCKEEVASYCDGYSASCGGAHTGVSCSGVFSMPSDESGLLCISGEFKSDSVGDCDKYSYSSCVGTTESIVGECNNGYKCGLDDDNRLCENHYMVITPCNTQDSTCTGGYGCSSVLDDEKICEVCYGFLYTAGCDSECYSCDGTTQQQTETICTSCDQGEAECSKCDEGNYEECNQCYDSLYLEDKDSWVNYCAEAYIACGSTYENCMDSSNCHEDFDSAAGCATGQGCGTCEATCQSTCETSCQTACETSCQSTCETTCQSTSQTCSSCHSSCQSTCESSCQTVVETCSSCNTGAWSCSGNDSGGHCSTFNCIENF